MIMEPGIDGLETYQKILELHPGQKAIIVSGFSESDAVTSAQELGAGTFMLKAYLVTELGQAVKTVLKRRTLTSL